MFKNIVFPVLILSSMINSEVRRKSGSLRRRTDHSSDESRVQREPSDYSTEDSNRANIDDSEDHSKIAVDKYKDDSFESRGRRTNSRRRSSRRISTSIRDSRTTAASTTAEKLDRSVSNLEPDTTFEDFDVQNKELQVYVNKLRKRVVRLKHVKVKFRDVQRNYVLRHRMDTIEKKYLNNVEFIRQNQDYNETLFKLISTFNDMRRANGWTKLINVTQITVMKKVKNEEGHITHTYPDLPKLFLTRQEKWYTCTEWLQNLHTERVLHLKNTSSVLYYLRQNIFEQFEERPICSSEVGAGMDELYGIASTNVKSFQEISDLENYKISKMSLRSLDENEIISKCQRVLLSLNNIK